jgi:dihydroorotate dehydrogenase
MDNMYKVIIKPLFFLFPPELAHHITVTIFKVLLKIPLLSSLIQGYFRVEHPELKRFFLGLSFSNPVGLAAGFDKDGKYLDTMSALGFGFIEIGTITPLPQPGNAKPRLFRLPKDLALINRMGFNNEGIQPLITRLKNRPKNLIVGGNIGKNKNTSQEEAVLDYGHSFRQLFPYVDYFAVNVSSPNTPGLRQLQEREPLEQLLLYLQEINRELGGKPILLKIAPDLNFEELDDILHIVQKAQLDGVIATNTTISREGLTTDSAIIDEIGNGGLSGKPLKKRATEVIRYLSQKSNGQLFIIGVGGIFSTEDALEKINAGASLIQVYTGLIYEGPSLVKKINKGILDS